jgi:selenocysteine lyase/cysteine desulfurase
VVGQESVKGQYDRWQWAETARRFEVGHRNSVAAIAVLASLTLLRQVSIEIVAEHIYNLRAYLVDQLRALGFLVVAPDAHSHIVSIQPANVRAADMVQKLSQRSVKSAARGPFVRFSLHGYNTYDDVDRLTKILLSDAMR